MKKQITLAYSFDALEPYIDQTTMETHYTKHHKAYTDNLNATIQQTPQLHDKCTKWILRNFDSLPEQVKPTIRNNGGGFVNHNLYFDILSPTPNQLSGELKAKIEETFTSQEKLIEILTDLAMKQFGSGWAWLAVDEKTKQLVTLSTPNQDSPFMQGYYPILGIDVWEHAYYLKYKNLRKNYIEQFFNVVDWDKVASYYQKALEV